MVFSMNKFVMFNQNNLAMLLTTAVVIVMIHIVSENMRSVVCSGNARISLSFQKSY
jgi:hypothetical protein